MEPLSVLIVDDASIMRQRLRFMFGRAEGLQVVGEAGSAEECLELYPRLRPDVVTVDISLPGLSGIELTERLLAEDDPPRVAVITNYPYVGFRARSLEVGASLFLSKNDPAEHIVGSIVALGGEGSSVVSGERFP